MIEFNGYLSGAAEKRFRKRSRDLVQNALLIALLFLFSTIAFVAVKMRYMPLLIAYCAMFVVVPLLARIPQSKKERMSLTPKKIVIDGESLTCVADKYVESKLVDDVKRVRDFGEFYEIVFPFGKMSEKFICQKDLLTKGSIEEFEKLFAEKIEKA